jgi:type VI secretion system protein ImpF
MSGSRGWSATARPAPARDAMVQRPPLRAQLPLLDRLIDEAPEKAQDSPMTASDAMAILRRSVRRDLEALLNSRRLWLSSDASFKELSVSPLQYGIPDCAGGRFHGMGQQELLRREIEDTIRRFEPRFRSVRVNLTSPDDRKDTTLRLRIDAVLLADPAPEPISFDTMVDTTTADVLVRTRDDG